MLEGIKKCFFFLDGCSENGDIGEVVSVGWVFNPPRKESVKQSNFFRKGI
jgi:hypothetical protein